MAKQKPERLDSPSVQKLGAVIANEARERARKALTGATSKERSSKADLAEASVGAFRGAVGIAARLRIEYEASDKGSSQRANILKTLWDMVKENDRQNESASIDGMSDQEIEDEIALIMEGRMKKDIGSPHTQAGRELLNDLLSSVGEDEYASLEREMKALDENFEFDKPSRHLAERQTKTTTKKSLSGTTTKCHFPRRSSPPKRRPTTNSLRSTGSSIVRRLARPS